MCKLTEYMNMSTNKTEHNFKVGDKVRVLVQANSGLVNVGTVDVITAVNHRRGTVAVEVGSRSRNCFYGGAGGKLELVTTAKYPNPPHKHAELIKDWADGAEIEYQVRPDGGWYNAGSSPVFYNYNNYRIKPAPPVKSDKDIQIEKLEQQAIDLAAAISKLKDGA